MKEIDPVGEGSRVVYFWLKSEILGLNRYSSYEPQERDRLWREVKDVNTWL